MATSTLGPPARRAPLTKERVLAAALVLADAGGLEALSMRKLGQALGVEAMAVYYHFANKERVLDGIVVAQVGRTGVGPRLHQADRPSMTQ